MSDLKKKLMAKAAKTLTPTKLAKSTVNRDPEVGARKTSSSPKRKRQGGHYERITFSLFPTDQQRITAVVNFMSGRGKRINTSQAIRAAIRSVNLDPKLDSILESMKGEDQRRQ